MRYYLNMDALLAIALQVEWVLVELEEIPFELLRVDHEEGVVANVVQKQINVLNDSFIKKKLNKGLHQVMELDHRLPTFF